MIQLTEDLHRYFSEVANRRGVPLNDLVNETLGKAVAIAELAA